ncbi:MAG TPA: hypothetical protein VL242_19195 [Sorangium sp.]|nr:hypothetical protein [Sorangium sp.]
MEDPDEDPGRGQERTPFSIEEAIDHVQTDFSRQAQDPGWTREMEDKVAENLRTALAGGMIQAVDCRVSVCRIELLYRGEEQYRQAMNGVSALSDSEKVATKGAERADQQWPMIVYLARHGTELPKLD